MAGICSVFRGCESQKETLPKTNTSHLKMDENGWLEEKFFFGGDGFLAGAFAVSFRECIRRNRIKNTKQTRLKGQKDTNPKMVYLDDSFYHETYS